MHNRNLKNAVLCCSTALTVLGLVLSASAALPLVREGQPLAEIVIAENPLPQVTLAAAELRDYLRKMSGAELAIVTTPGGILTPIYVGESDFTRQQGLTLDGSAKEGYRVVATDRYLALFGCDAIFPFYPRDHKDASSRDRLLKEWQEFVGEPCGFPFLALYDPRYYNSEFGFSLLDPSGTLFAVYDLLEQLGVRWYSPQEELGTVFPKAANFGVVVQDLTRKPAFERRFLRFGWGSNRATFLWSKRLRLGLSELAWLCHGTSLVTEYNKEAHPEYLAIVGGQLQSQGDYGPGQSRLAAPLRDAMIRFGTKLFDRYSELRHMSTGPNDGYTVIDDRDRDAGWMRSRYGSRGELSDYVWTFVNEVAMGVAQSHPGKYIMGLAYSRYRMPPPAIETFDPAVGVTYCQTRAVEMVDPEARRVVIAEREAWRRKLPSGEFYLWEYFLWHRKGQALWGVPVIFTKLMQEDMRSLNGLSKGEYVEAWSLQGGEMWGLNHLTIYLQARLYWEPDLDLDTLLEEYYRLFYGPAAGEMREFFEYAEEVWMRPAPRQTVLMGEDGVPKREGFLQPADVPRYFEILERARNKTGDDPYRQRIDLIVGECLPMRTMFAFQEYFDKGQAAAKAKDGTAAAENLEQAVALAHENRKRANAAYALGQVYRDLLQDEERALQAFHTVLKTPIDGGGSAVRLHARMDVVGLLRKAGRYDEALALLDEDSGMQRHDYWWARSLAARGLIAEALKQKDKAIAYYQEAMALPNLDKSQADWLRKQLETLTP